MARAGPNHGGDPPPLLLAFGFGPAALETELLERIARRHDHAFRLLLVHEEPGRGFTLGQDRLGETIGEVAESLRSAVAGVRPGGLITFGQGIGGHAALIFGVLLEAGRIVAVEPPAHLVTEELARYNDGRWREVLEGFSHDPDRRIDIAELIADHGFEGRASVLFGTRRQNDHHDAVHLNVVHAQRLALSDCVRLYPFPDHGQGLLEALAERGEAEAVLAQHLLGDVPLPQTRSALDREKLKLITSKLHQKFTLQICTRSERLDVDDPAALDDDVAFAVAGEVDVDATRLVNDGWRRWIAGNLMLGASPGGLEDTLVGSGISEREASEEVWRAMQSPYLWGAQRLQNRLKKRDWQLAAYRKLQRLRPGSSEIVRRRATSAAEFLVDHCATSRPVILSGLIDDWRALREWGLEPIARRLGDRQVEVEVARDAFSDVEAALEVELVTMTMAAFVERLRQLDAEEFVALVVAAGSINDAALAELRDDLGPVGDLLEALPPDSRAGSIRFSSPGAIVPFRHTLAGTLVAQVAGRTRFLVAPSWDLPLMANTRHVFSQLDGRSMSQAPSPPLDEPQILECRLAPGEVLFLPVGAWSFAESLEASATVTFTNLAFENDFTDGYPGDVET